MLQKEIKDILQRDLDIKERRARAYAKEFMTRYNGCKSAITDAWASYTNSGKIKVTYVINKRRLYIILDGKDPYFIEVERRKNKEK